MTITQAVKNLNIRLNELAIEYNWEVLFENDSKQQPNDREYLYQETQFQQADMLAYDGNGRLDQNNCMYIIKIKFPIQTGTQFALEVFDVLYANLSHYTNPNTDVLAIQDQYENEDMQTWTCLLNVYTYSTMTRQGI